MQHLSASDSPSNSHEVILSACGRTVWVNAPDGSCVGRFSKTFGVDVHTTGVQQMSGNAECLYCTHEKPGPSEWTRFRAEMLAHHGVAIDEHLLTWNTPS